MLPAASRCRALKATVISTVADRASKAAQAPGQAASQPVTPGEPTEAEIRREYDRILALMPPVKEYHVRHILVRRREDALSVLKWLKSGTSFKDAAADISIARSTAPC